MKKHAHTGFLLFLLLTTLPSCSIPFSDYQTAKTVGKGNQETTFFISGYVCENFKNVENLEDGMAGLPLILMGAHHDKGLLDGFDLRTSISTNLIDYTFGIAPKVSIIKDVFSFTIPVGYEFSLPIAYAFMLDDQSSIRSTYYILPTFLLTLQLNKYIDLTTTPKIIYYHFEGAWREPQLGSNFGISFHTKSSRFSFRPEFGFSSPMNDIFGSSTTAHLGLAISFRIGNNVH